MSSQVPEPELLDNLAAIPSDRQGLFTTFAMLRSFRQGRTTQGKPYVDLEISDCSATVAGKIWDDADKAQTEIRQLRCGQPVKVMFHADSYQGRLQLNVKGLRAAESGEANYLPAQVYGEGIELVEDLLCETLVFDIETVPATDKRKLPNSVAESLGKFADRREMESAAIMGMSPFFGKIVSLALGEGEIELDRQRVTTLVVPPEGADHSAYPDWMRPMTEGDLLRAFWSLASAANVVVTFNGRGFDLPFLITRSLIHDIPARVDLVSSKWSLRPHLDLYQVMSQDSRGLGPQNLDVVCWALGIESPKGAMDGSMVAPAYERGEIEEIARYNVADVHATTAVYHKLRESILQFRKDW